jgi:hypothetical protein
MTDAVGTTTTQKLEIAAMKTNSKNQVGVKVNAGVKAGGFALNHSRKVLAVKSGLKAGDGILLGNHSRRLA